MTTSDITWLRLRNQQILRPSFKSPTDVVRWFGALQSQDLASSLYAIGLRMPTASEGLVERALVDKTVVRTWPMRRTIHCMPVEYTVAYADRSATADEVILAEINHGISPNIVINGRIAGTWQRKMSSHQVVVGCKLLRRLTRSKQGELAKAADEYGNFVGRSAPVSIAHAPYASSRV